MTIYQILALAIAGPIGLICFMRMIITLFYKNVDNFELVHAILMVACALAIIVAFTGIKWPT